MKKSSSSTGKLSERPFSMCLQKSKSYLCEPNGNSKKLRKSVSDVRNEKYRCSQRLKSSAEGRLREQSNSLAEKNSSWKSGKVSQTATRMEGPFPCHISEETLECEVCTKAFRHQTNLKRHYRVHLQDKSFAFNKSQRPFEDENHLKRHFISYSLRKRIDSKKCLNAIKLSDYQTKEVKTNSEYKPLFRNTRVQTIKQIIQLKNSTAIKEERSFSCSMCKKLFKRKDHLKRHFSTHTGNKPFSCATCKMLFKRKDHLKRHFRTHTEDKPFSCGTCKKSFYRKDHLKKHFSVHTESKTFSRVACKKRFTLKSHLKKHLRIHLSDKLSCYKCNKTFKHKNHLKLHNRIHIKKDTFSCKKCEKTFKQEIYLQRHLIIHSRNNAFVRSKHKNKFRCKVGVKGHLDGKFKPFDQKVCKKVFKGIDEMKNFSGVCTRSKSLSNENCGKDFDHKYESLRTTSTDTTINSYDCSTPGTIQEDNRKLEEKHSTDLEENSLRGNTHLEQKIENRLMVQINTEKFQDCCDSKKKIPNHIELSQTKRTKISKYSEICTRFKSLSIKTCEKNFDHIYDLSTTGCTYSRSNYFDWSTPGTILGVNRQLEVKVCTDLTGNTHLKQAIQDELMIHINTEKENSQDCCDNETKNPNQIKLNEVKGANISGNSVIFTRSRLLSSKNCEKGFNHKDELVSTTCTDSKTNSYDCSVLDKIRKDNRQLKEKVCADLLENSLIDNSHLKQTVQNELMEHINTEKGNSQDCCDDESLNPNHTELNQVKGTNISAYSGICTRSKSLSSKNCEKGFDHRDKLSSTTCTDSEKNSHDCFSPGTIRKDNRQLEEKVCTDLEENSHDCFSPGTIRKDSRQLEDVCTDLAENALTGNTHLKQTTQKELMIHINAEKQNPQDCCDNQTKNPNQIELNQVKGTNISAYSGICTRSRSLSSKNCEKGFDHRDELSSTTCTDSKNNSHDCFSPGTIQKDNRQLKEDVCTDLAENALTGNAHLKQTTQKELMIHINAEKQNPQDCCDNETKNPNQIELYQVKGTNISAYSGICTRSRSLSSKKCEKGFDYSDELSSTTCTDSKNNSHDCFSPGTIRKDNRQLEEKVCTDLAENSLIDNSHLKQTIQNELMEHINTDKENSQDCCEDESKNPNHIELNQVKGAKISAYSEICTSSKSLFIENYSKVYDPKYELSCGACTDFKNNSYDCLSPGTIREDNGQLEGKVCTDLAENSLTGNTHLKHLIQNELMIHINTEKGNSQDCCDDEAKSPNHIELNQMKEPNISAYSIICSYCEENFKRHGDLQRHLRAHRSSVKSANETEDPN